MNKFICKHTVTHRSKSISDDNKGVKHFVGEAIGAMKPKNLLLKNTHHKSLSRQKAFPKLTDDTIEKYREAILAGGRKFKYPVQANKHRILIISLASVVLTLLIFVGWIYAMLYHVQSSADFYYDVVRIAPLPVARVDDQSVNYGDYLRRLRADVYYYAAQENNNLLKKTNRSELDYNKRKDLNAAELSAYAQKIATARGLTVSEGDVTAAINDQLTNEKIDQPTLARTLKLYYNWSMDEYRDAIHSQLLIKKVSFAIDQRAKAKADSIYRQLANGADFSSLAKNQSDNSASRASGGEIDGTAKDDSLPFILAKKMQVGQTSRPTESSDNSLSYIIVKLISRDGDRVKVGLIQIDLKQLSDDFNQLRRDHKITEYISIPHSNSFNQ